MWLWLAAFILGLLVIKGLLVYSQKKSSVELLFNSLNHLISAPELNTNSLIMERLSIILKRLEKLENHLDDISIKIDQLAWSDSSSKQLVRIEKEEDQEDFLLARRPETEPINQETPKARLLRLLQEFESEVFEKEEQYHYSGWKQKLEDKLKDYPKLIGHLLEKSKTLGELRLNLGRLRSYVDSIGDYIEADDLNEFTEGLTFVDDKVGSFFEKLLQTDKKEIGSEDLLSSINTLLAENQVNFQLPPGFLPNFSMNKETFQKGIKSGLANPGTSMKFFNLNVSVTQQVAAEKPLLTLVTDPKFFVDLREILLLKIDEKENQFYQDFLQWTEYPSLNFESLATQNLINEVEHQLVKQQSYKFYLPETCLIFYFIGSRNLEITQKLLEKLFTAESYSSMKNLLEAWSNLNLLE